MIAASAPVRRLRAGAALSAVLILAACSSGEAGGAVTADDARQLNEAAAMLDANSVAVNAVALNESPSP